MALYCNDVDLLLLEAALFADPAFVSFRRLSGASATLAGCTLTLAAPGATFASAGITPGMVATLSLPDGTSATHTEIVAVTGPAAATVSIARAAPGDPAIPPPLSGPVNVQITSFAAQASAIGDQLRAALGLHGEGAVPPPAEHPIHFRAAAVCGTLAILYRTLLSVKDAPAQTAAKLQLYAAAFNALRRQIAAGIDTNGDGRPDKLISAGVVELYRA